MNPRLAEIIDAVSKPTRSARQTVIEQLLIEFRADPEEAQELLICLIGRLSEDDEILHYMTSLRKSLDRYSRRQALHEEDEDEAYSLWRARQE